VGGKGNLPFRLLSMAVGELVDELSGAPLAMIIIIITVTITNIAILRYERCPCKPDIVTEEDHYDGTAGCWRSKVTRNQSINSLSKEYKFSSWRLLQDTIHDKQSSEVEQVKG